MSLTSLADIWKYVVGPVAGAVVGFIGKWLLDRRKERLEKTKSVQVVECVELVNKKVFDKAVFGPMARNIEIQVPEMSPESKRISIDEVYFARYRLRNLSDTPISNFFVGSKNEPKSVHFDITEVTEGKEGKTPNWERQFRALLEETKVSEERGWAAYPIPYLNPYSSTQHEVYLDLSSYLPLSEIEIIGGAQGVKFEFRKASDTA
jgi:hypothetical protein